MYGIENKEKIFLFEDAVVSFFVMRTIQFFFEEITGFRRKNRKKNSFSYYIRDQREKIVE